MPITIARPRGGAPDSAATPLELVCPAGSLPALKAAIDNGADCVYLGFRDATNARNFAGLNCDAKAIAEGIRYAQARNRKVFLALNTYPQPHAWREWQQAMDRAAASTHGVCSPAHYVRWQGTPEGLESRLNGVLIDRYDANENAGYPTLCKGRFDVAGENYYALEEPTSLNTLELLPQLMAMGVRAVKIEGRQRSPAYVAQVTRVWRRALDHVAANAARYSVHPAWSEELDKVSEGQQQTLGAYHRPRVQTLQFYEAVREWPVDMVYLGETVCSRRHELRFQDWLEVADMLNDAGKNVVLSTQVLHMDVLKPGRVLSTLLRHAA